MTPPTLLLSEDPMRTVSTGAAPDGSLAHEADKRAARKDAWQKVIDSKLIEWGRNPDGIAEYDLIPPTHAAIRYAIKLVNALSQDDLPPPTRVVPDGGGGIVLEHDIATSSVAFEIDDSGECEFVVTEDGRVNKRITLQVE